MSASVMTVILISSTRNASEDWDAANNVAENASSKNINVGDDKFKCANFEF